MTVSRISGEHAICVSGHAFAKGRGSKAHVPHARTLQDSLAGYEDWWQEENAEYGTSRSKHLKNLLFLFPPIEWEAAQDLREREVEPMLAC